MENQYRGELPKKGVLGQVVELRGGGGLDKKEGGGGFFLWGDAPMHTIMM